MNWSADDEILWASEVVAWTCPENPERLAGYPIGMYHCPSCGCMAIGGQAGHPHDTHCWMGLWPHRFDYGWWLSD